MPRCMLDKFNAWSAVCEGIELSEGALKDIAQTLVEHSALGGDIDSYAQQQWQEVQNGLVASLCVHQMVLQGLKSAIGVLDELGWGEMDV